MIQQIKLMLVKNEATLTDVTNENGTKNTVQPVSAPPSPYSKHVSMPPLDNSTTIHRVKNNTMHRAITD